VSYRCRLCDWKVADRIPRLVHYVYRVVSNTQYPHLSKKPTITQIEREIPVCKKCKQDLANGDTIESLMARLKPKPKVEEPVPAEPIDDQVTNNKATKQPKDVRVSRPKFKPLV